jgi:hypothetical protein
MAHHYHPPTPAVGDNAGGTAQTIALGLAPMRMLSPAQPAMSVHRRGSARDATGSTIGQPLPPRL